MTFLLLTLNYTTLIGAIFISVDSMSSDLYSMKAYLHDILQYDNLSKIAGLHLQGFVPDIVGKFETKESTAWQSRRAMFLESTKGQSGSETEVFRTDPLPIIGQLITPFINVQKRE